MKLKSIFLLLCMLALENAKAQTFIHMNMVLTPSLKPVPYILINQTNEEHNLQKSKIDSMYNSLEEYENSLYCCYTKVNSSDEGYLKIEENILIVTSVVYPKYSLSGPITYITTYKFSELKNDTLMVFGIEKNESTSLPELGGGKSINRNFSVAEYYTELQKIRLEKITDDIILFEGIYYHKAY